MTNRMGDTVKADPPFNHLNPDEIHFDEHGLYIHQRRKRYFSILFAVAAFSALVSFALTWAIVSSRPVKVTFSLPSATSSTAATTPVATNPNSTGQTALTESQLKAEVKNVGGAIFWAGAQSGALYTYNHIAAGEDYIRYLPNGQGLTDKTQNYRVIATYKEATAYDTVVAAGKKKTGVSLTNPDGSVIYYSNATPTHVYMAFKGFGYQIEIFDPIPGASLKLATTPGAVVNLLK